MFISDWIAHRAVRRGLYVACVVLVVALLVTFLCRGAILRSYVAHKMAKVERRFDLSIKYSALSFKSLSTIKIEGLSVVPAGCDTLLLANDISVRLNPWCMLLGRVDVKYLESHGLHLQFIKNDSLSNYDFIYPKGDSSNVSVQADSAELTHNTSINFSRDADGIFGVIFSLLPSDASLSDLSVKYTRGDYSLTISLAQFDIRDNLFRSEIMVSEPDKQACWITEGEILDSDRNLHLKLYSKTDQSITLPFLPFRWNAQVTFDTLTFNVSQRALGHGVTSFSGQASVSGLALFHEGISPERVLLDRGRFDYRINIGKSYIELDSATTIGFNRIDFHPYLLAERDARWHIRASINKETFAADDLFSSLPRGLFHNLEGIKTEGNLSYHMLFDLDFGSVDSMKLESRLLRDGFRIKQFGNSDLRRMNSEFTYTAYDRGVAVRSFEVGEGNPNFCPLSAISPLLQMSVMQSEDGAFFHHNGFLIDCMRDALIEDIKQRRFARGGSTISMQLVKNVFLNRHKTIARKIEEALIVWLIETNRLTSKERMFEVYMNIIEWGPLVYGANEAARYYFDKQASELDINESIFLAGIVPSPKRALGSFTDSLQLRPYMEGYFRIMAQRLVVKGLISQEQADDIRPMVELRGQAREALLRRGELAQQVADSVPSDVFDPAPLPLGMVD